MKIVEKQKRKHVSKETFETFRKNGYVRDLTISMY